MTPLLLPSKPSNTDLKARIHRTAAEIEELRPFWTAQQQHPNSDLERFLLVCDLLPEVIAPCAISVWQGGFCRAVLVGRIEHANFQPRLGYLKLPRLRGRRLSIIHQGVIGQLGSLDVELIINKIKQLLADRVVDMAAFNSISEDSPLVTWMAAQPSDTLGIINPRWLSHWELSLQKETGFLMKTMKSKHRSLFLNKAQSFEAAYPRRITWHWHTSISDVIPICRQMEAVAARTYQRGLGSSFKDDRLHRELLSLAARQGTLRVMILEIDHQPAAFWFGTIYRGAFYPEATGFVPEHRQHEIGTQLLFRVVDELVKEGISRFDFGLGDAHYKQRFGDRSWRETTMRLFSRRLRGRALRAYFRTVEALDRRLRALVQRYANADRIKLAWRLRLTGDAIPTPITPKQPGKTAQS